MNLPLLTVRNVIVILSVLVGFLTHMPQAAAQTFILSSSPTVGTGPKSVVAADVNGDGKPDLICANAVDNTLTVLTNNGNGTFTLSATLVVGRAPRFIAVADVDGDGTPDLISANILDNNLTVLTNTGSGTFSLSSSPRVGAWPLAVLAADVNGDGKLDLISANLDGNSLTVLTNNGDGTFTLSATIGLEDGPISVVAADVNMDGKLDLICANNLHPNGTPANTLTVLTNNGRGTFTFSAELVVAGQPASVVAADVNGDGRPDLVCANYELPDGTSANTLTVLTNMGNGAFTFSVTLEVGENPAAVVAADFNGDGWLDLISADSGNGSGKTLTVLTNNQHGEFSLSAKPDVGLGPQSVAVADVNGDGKLDLISANYGNPVLGNTLTVLLNSPAAPSLNIQLTSTNTTVLSWAAVVPGFGLQQNSVLDTTNWIGASNAVTRVGAENQVIILRQTENNFYRLFHP